MINYLLVILADILLVLNFITQKKYQACEGNSVSAGLFYSLATGLVSSVIIVFMSGFNLEFGTYSFIMALLQTSLCTIYTLISFKILKEGNVSLYTLFLMTGGMVLPYIFGVLFLKEELTVMRSVGLICIIIAIVLSDTGIKRPSKKQLLLCIFVFVLNGFVSIVSKLHQIESTYKAVDSTSFVFLTSIIKFFICIPFFLLSRKGKTEYCKPNLKKSSLPIIFSSLFSSLSYALQLTGAAKLPVTVVYPLISGGSIILTTCVGFLILKEKPTREQIIGICICFVGTCLFL